MDYRAIMENRRDYLEAERAFSHGIFDKVADIPGAKAIDNSIIRFIYHANSYDFSLLCPSVLELSEELAESISRRIGDDFLFPQAVIDEFSYNIFNLRGFIKDLKRRKKIVERAVKRHDSSRAYDDKGHSKVGQSTIDLLNKYLGKRCWMRDRVFLPRLLEDRIDKDVVPHVSSLERHVDHIARRFNTQIDYSSRYWGKRSNPENAGNDIKIFAHSLALNSPVTLVTADSDFIRLFGAYSKVFYDEPRRMRAFPDGFFNPDKVQVAFLSQKNYNFNFTFSDNGSITDVEQRTADL